MEKDLFEQGRMPFLANAELASKNPPRPENALESPEDILMRLETCSKIIDILVAKYDKKSKDVINSLVIDISQANAVLAVKAEERSNAEGKILDLEKQCKLTNENLNNASACLAAMQAKWQSGFSRRFDEGIVDTKPLSAMVTWTNKRSAEHLHQPSPSARQRVASCAEMYMDSEALVRGEALAVPVAVGGDDWAEHSEFEGVVWKRETSSMAVDIDGGEEDDIEGTDVEEAGRKRRYETNRNIGVHKNTAYIEKLNLDVAERNIFRPDPVTVFRVQLSVFFVLVVYTFVSEALYCMLL